MSFGWSAGDIATAVTVVYKLIQALDSCDGAAGDYRETVSLLRDLKRTLEPLQTFTAWNAYPAYGQDIGEHIGYIKGPVKQFLSTIRKYEPSLGAGAQDGHHRHIARKLQWHIFMSKKVLGLKKKIDSHMRVIDTLMQRLTLDLVWTTQQKLPDTLRATFQETLRPELIAILQEHLPPLNSALIETYEETQSQSRAAQDLRLLELYEGLSSSVKDIKQQISSPTITKQRIESCLRSDAPETMPSALASAESSGLHLDRNTKYRDQDWRSMLQEFVQEVCYLIFLYIGHFLKSLFLVLSRLVQPSQALMPTLLSKYNITFLDAIGRQPRILPYEYFRSFKVLQAFIQHEFKDLPGSVWVDQGRYLILNLTNDRVLNERNWGDIVVPGTKIAMSMLLQKRLMLSLESQEQRCPEVRCSGTWTRPCTQAWAKCPVCKKEIFSSVSSESGGASVQNASNNSDSEARSSIDQSVVQRSVETYSQETIVEGTLHLNDDISMFKRVTQQFFAESNTHPSSPRRVKVHVASSRKERTKERSKQEKKKAHNGREKERGEKRKSAGAEKHRSRQFPLFEETSDSSNDDFSLASGRTRKYLVNMENAVKYVLSHEKIVFSREHDSTPATPPPASPRPRPPPPPPPGIRR